MTEQDRRQLNEKIAYCLEQLDEAQKYLRDGLTKETAIFVGNALKEVQNVKFRLTLG